MHNMFPRLTAALLWLKSRFEKITSRRYGRAGLYAFAMIAGFVSAHPVFAEQGAFDKFVLFLANIAIVIAAFLSKLVVVIIEVLIPVMLYNNFSSSPVVSAGWAIVRDTVNMFFVILLIVIAFGTIFGSGRFNAQRQIPRLMIFAIVINFSKTLCGLMIDVGQVIMLTFANAIREIAAGNFIQMLGMGDIYSLSTKNDLFDNAALDSGATGVQAFDWFASSVASVFMMLIVLGTMLMLLGILVYRVVMLWILIVIAPIAWFVGGAGDLIKSGAYGDWWNKFKCLVAIGPVLAFFLWLTLVVVGAGNIAGEAGFTSGDSASIGSTAGGFLTKIFELNRLISFVIGIAMLYAGFEAAQSVCGAAGLGFVSSNLKGGPLKNQIASTVAGLGARAGARGARVAGGAVRGAYNKGVVPLAQNIAAGTNLQNIPVAGMATKAGRENFYRRVAQGSGSGVIGKTIGRMATAQADKLSSARAQQIEDAGKKYKSDSREAKVDQLRRFQQSPAWTTGGKKEAQALLLDAMGDEKSMKELRASGDLEKLWKQYGAGLEKDVKGNKDLSTKLSGFKKQHADITGATGDIKELKDVVGLSSFALGSDAVKGRLAEIQTTIKNEKGGFYNAQEAMAAGLIGNKEQRDAINKGSGAIYDGMNDAELARVPIEALAKNASVDLLAKKPAMADQLAVTQNMTIRAEMFKRAQGDDTLAGVLAARGGLNLKEGKVEKADASRFVQTLMQNPAFLNNMKDEHFDKMMQDDETRKLIGQALTTKGTLNSAVRDIKADPNSDASKQLRSRIEQVLSSARNEQKSAQVDEAVNAFDVHMSVVDQRSASSTTSVPVGEQKKDINITVGDLNAREAKGKATSNEAKLEGLDYLRTKLQKEADEIVDRVAAGGDGTGLNDVQEKIDRIESLSERLRSAGTNTDIGSLDQKSAEVLAAAMTARQDDEANVVADRIKTAADKAAADLATVQAAATEEIEKAARAAKDQQDLIDRINQQGGGGRPT